MTKRLASKHKVDRRLKTNLWGRPKSPFNTRNYPPGQHGKDKKGKPSDYGNQLEAKQKMKSWKFQRDIFVVDQLVHIIFYKLKLPKNY